MILSDYYRNITINCLDKVYYIFLKELSETTTLLELENIKKKYIGKDGVVTKIISDYNNKMKELRLKNESK